MNEGESPTVWHELREQRDLLIELRTLMQAFAEFKNDTNKRLDIQDGRISALESRRFPLSVITGLTSVVSVSVAAYAVATGK